MNKEELLENLENSRESFMEILEGIEDERFVESGVIGDWSIKDILAHMTIWEAQLVTLLFQAKRGRAPQVLEVFRRDENISNEDWYNQFKDRDLELVFEDFNGVRNQTMRRIEEFSEDELMKPGYYGWASDRPLLEWISACTFDHEAEHAPQIRVWLAKQSN